MIQILALSLLILGTPPADDVLTVSAELEAGDLKVGSEHEIVIKVGIKEGWSASQAGLPAPLLQIDAPPSVKLAGEILTTYKELSKNEFLQAPFERLLKKQEERVKFMLVQRPDPDEQIGLNIMAYVSEDPTVNSYFIRRRLTLEPAPGAKATQADAAKSDWGFDKNLLQIGDVAADFNLPKAFFPPVSLGHYLGEKNIIVATYRAYWSPFCVNELDRLQKIYGEFTQRDTVVIAIAQEDKDLESHAKILNQFKPAPHFDIVVDFRRVQSQAYKRTTAYLIDKKGIVRQIFPMIIHGRPSWHAILNEIDRINAIP